MFYVNKDGSLDYKRMIEEVYEDIQAWKMKPRALDKDKNNNKSRKYKYHPYMEDKVKMQNLYN